MEGVEGGTLFVTKDGPSSLAALKEHWARHAFLSVCIIYFKLFILEPHPLLTDGKKSGDLWGTGWLCSSLKGRRGNRALSSPETELVPQSSESPIWYHQLGLSLVQ